MTAEFVRRIRKEFTLTARGIHETVLAVAERVNRKVQVLRLHWEAASLSGQIERLHQQLGAALCAVLAPHDGRHALEIAHGTTEQYLSDISSRVRTLKKALLQVDPRVRQIESEAVREDLLNLERDLFHRSATIERLRVVPGAAASGCPVGQLGLPASVLFRPGDMVVLLGLRDELKSVLPLFSERKRATA